MKNQMNLILVYFAKKYNGNWDEIYQAIAKKEKVEMSELTKLEDDMDCKYITIIDEDYPNHFKSKYKPPFVLFYKNTKPTEENTNHLDEYAGAYVLD